MSTREKLEKRFDEDTREGLRKGAFKSSLFGVTVFAIFLALIFIAERPITRYAKGFLAAKLEKKSVEYDLSLGVIVEQAFINYKPSKIVEEQPQDKLSTKDKSIADSSAAPEAENEDVEAEKTSLRERMGKLKEFTANLDEETGSDSAALESTLRKGLEKGRGTGFVKEAEEKVASKLRTFIDEHQEEVMSRLIDEFTRASGEGALSIGEVLTALLQEKGSGDPSEIMMKYLAIATEKQASLFDQWEEEVRHDYDSMVARLLIELAQFSVINLAVFGLLALLLMRPHRFTLALVTPAIMMLLALIIGVVIYIFCQDWFSAVIYGEYWGWGYAWIPGAIFISLFDWVYLQGTLTQTVLEIVAVILDTMAVVLHVFLPLSG